ncbi:unnamed protein product [Linum trigynum]|uniref:Uncharacterized protein n=1 Tax=Linum trigynum TaxID=586398 RepID=A0AAV2G873_9ROSI
MAAASKVTLKLLVDKKSHKVLFGEAGKEFVDFLFTILSLPLGTVTRLLSKKYMYAVELVASPAKNNEAGWSGEEGGGFVKGVMTYMVMDDLEVKPMSTICSITLLNKFNIQEVGALEEMFIEIGMDEVTDPFRYD